MLRLHSGSALSVHEEKYLIELTEILMENEQSKILIKSTKFLVNSDRFNQENSEC